MKEITGHTRLTCLLGSPVAHSISPMMHNTAFEALGLDYRYLAFDIAPEQLKPVVNALRIMNVRGFNLTMPHKNAMCELCDHLSPAAKLIGAVNTVVNDNGIFTGYNTDGIGYMQSLKQANVDVLNKKITILGAGGAATSIFVQAALDGVAEISIFSRRSAFYDRAIAITEELKAHSSCKINLFDFSDADILKHEISESVLLINGTSVGMAPHTEASIITDPSMFHKNLTVSDVIYNPRETQFLRLARETGCHTLNGLYMLLFQGAEAFRLWTGHDMPVDDIKELYFS